MRLEGKTAVVMGAGQSPGVGVGNGRATCLLFAREGARVLAVDRDLESAEETAQLIRDEGGEALATMADVTDEGQVAAAIAKQQKNLLIRGAIRLGGEVADVGNPLFLVDHQVEHDIEVFGIEVKAGECTSIVLKRLPGFSEYDWPPKGVRIFQKKND